MSKVLVILGKEWLELRKERSLVLTSLLLPLFLTILPLGIAYGAGLAPDEDISMIGAAVADPAFAGMTAGELGQAVLGKQFGILFLLMPLFIPSIIASYSIVGEKTRRTLEPLLAAPIRTWELLLGKSLAALLPAVGITWVCAALFVGGMAVIALSSRVFSAVVSPAWVLVLMLCAPLLALIAVAATVAISSRVNDPRTAQQLSGVIVVPIMAVFFAQITGFLVLNPGLVLAGAAILLIVAALSIWGAARLFRREVILTRWR